MKSISKGTIEEYERYEGKMESFTVKFMEELLRYKEKEIGSGNLGLLVSTYENYMNRELEKLKEQNKALELMNAENNDALIDMRKDLDLLSEPIILTYEVNRIRNKWGLGEL